MEITKERQNAMMAAVAEVRALEAKQRLDSLSHEDFISEMRMKVADLIYGTEGSDALSECVHRLELVVRELEASERAESALESDVWDLQNEVSSLQDQVDDLEGEVQRLRNELEDRDAD